MSNTQICVCYPTPHGGPYDPVYHRQLLEQVQPNGMRFNFDARDEGRVERILEVNGNHTIVPILDFDYTTPPSWSAINRWAHTLSRIVFKHAPFIEIGNEPYTTSRMNPRWYACIVREVRQAVPDTLDVAVAADCVRPGGWFHPDWLTWWREVMTALTPGHDFQVAAIHPYRSYRATRTRSHWPNWAHKNPRIGGWIYREHDRAEEWRRLRQLVGADGGPVRLAGTEVGWEHSGLSDGAHAVNLSQEFAESREQQLVTCTVYHHGLMLDAQRQITPIGCVVRAWSQEVTETTP